MEYSAIVGEKVVLVCEVSLSTVEGTWYRKGQKVKLNKAVNAESEGTTRRLVLHNAKSADSGAYVFKTKEDEITINVTVKGKTSKKHCKVINNSNFGQH